MNKRITTLILAGSILSCSAFAAPTLTVSSHAIDQAGWLNSTYAMTKQAPKTSKQPIVLSSNISPDLTWKWQGRAQPKQVKSFAILITDPDIPNTPYFDVPGHIIKADDPSVQRVTAYHMDLVNIPATVHTLKKGQASNGLQPKPNPNHTKIGLSGFNVYQGWFKAHPILLGKKMTGTRRNFDGPNAPWNDLRVHNYTFTVYALDTSKLAGLPSNGNFTGPQALKAMQGHIVAKAAIIGKYSNNSAIKHH